MVAANEVRIGNMFVRELHGSRGLEYDHDFILTEEWMGKLFGDNISIALQDLFPIPLSPEILEKCGLTSHLYNDRDGYWEKNWFVLEGINNTGLYFGKMTKVTFLHQLQNLYYTLTGTELEIKL